MAMLGLSALLACAACQPSPDASLAANSAGQETPAQNAAQPDCREFTAPVTAAGQLEQASGQACRQPDGSWRVAQNTPGLPTQEYILPQPEQAPPPTNPETPPPAIAAAPQAANVGPPPPTQTASSEPSPPVPPRCTSYTVPLSVGGQPQQALIEACPQLDGSWRITQTTPGLPPQVYEVPPPPPYAPNPYDYAYAYPDFFPYWWGAPWVFGIGPSIVVVRRLNYFHHGFGHGFMHGFMHGGFVARGGGMAGGHR
jgi:surface antigen